VTEPQPKPDELDEYTRAHTTPPDELLQRLYDETHEKLSTPQMLTGPVEGRFLEMLVWVSEARRVLEIGTYSGYSALSMAAALPDDGELITCDVWEEAHETAKRYAAESPHGHKVDFRLGPALETIETLEGPFDLVFIDADKTGYPDYYEEIITRLLPGGLLLIDNVLLGGGVTTPQEERERIMDALNERVTGDERVDSAMVLVADGLTFVRRR
jgi:caffeoyl-CoA O-methyltransferase